MSRFCISTKPLPEIEKNIQIKIASFLEKPKGDVLITGHNSSSILFADGSTVSLRCHVDGGKPPPTLTFTCDNGMVGTTDATQVSTMDISVDMSLHGVVCECVAEQVWSNYSSRDSVMFNVACEYLIHYCINFLKYFFAKDH